MSDGLGKLQFYTILLKYIKDGNLSKEDVKEWLEVQVEELGVMYDPLELLEFIQIGTRVFAELVTEATLEMKRDYRKPGDERKFYTSTEVWKGLGMTKGSFDVWKKRGYFSNAIKGTKVWEVPKSDLDEFLDSKERYRIKWDLNH